MTANWEANSDNRWTIPVGGGVGKIFKIGKQPVNGQVSAYYNVSARDSAPLQPWCSYAYFIFQGNNASIFSNVSAVAMCCNT